MQIKNGFNFASFKTWKEVKFNSSVNREINRIHSLKVKNLSELAASNEFNLIIFTHLTLRM